MDNLNNKISNEAKNQPSSLGAVSSSLFIGEYKIEVIDQDYFKITKKYNDEFFNEAKVCGGDLETLLSCLFIRQEIKYTCYSRVMKTDIVPFEENTD